MTKLLHIGLGKCASTFLQRDIFPKLEKKINTNYIKLNKNDFFDIKKKEFKYSFFENYKNIEKLLPNDFIISNEGFFSRGWEFSRIEKNFECIKNNFSDDTVILIIIRNPYDLLNSIYCQSIHNMNIVKPENFFYIDDKEINIRVNNRFNLHNFNYSKLISLYKSYFKKVVVVKYENLKKLDFLKNIFNLDDEYLQNLKKNTSKYYNKSISKYGINFILFLNKFFDVSKSQKFIRKFINPPNNIIFKIKNKILSLFYLRSFFQNKFDRIFPYKKYYISRKFIPLDIEKKILEYDKLDF
ncbi:hypothetical protein ACIJYF_00075 [Candidatus Pelagibacter bacterium nBUS_49]|uniref:hypothetical protein n=1 Tax=Candidatus Pelagibacter bacterium nBUS_49 TaxID=3374196 RepID=UPI003EBAB5AC